MKKGKAKPVPEGYHTATPYLIVDGAAKALDFYQRVFGATERMRMPGPGGKVGHAEINVGDSVIMLADEHPEIGARGPRAYGGAAVSLHLYVPDVDAVVTKAVAAGATLLRPVEDKFYGDRMGTIEDPLRAPLARLHSPGGRAARRDGAPGCRREQARVVGSRPGTPRDERLVFGPYRLEGRLGFRADPASRAGLRPVRTSRPRGSPRTGRPRRRRDSGRCRCSSRPRSRTGRSCSRR